MVSLDEIEVEGGFKYYIQQTYKVFVMSTEYPGDGNFSYYRQQSY